MRNLGELFGEFYIKGTMKKILNEITGICSIIFLEFPKYGSQIEKNKVDLLYSLPFWNAITLNK